MIPFGKIDLSPERQRHDRLDVWYVLDTYDAGSKTKLLAEK